MLKLAQSGKDKIFNGAFSEGAKTRINLVEYDVLEKAKLIHMPFEHRTNYYQGATKNPVVLNFYQSDFEELK